jgi:hypothetical protein
LGNGTPDENLDQDQDENGLDNPDPATNGIRSSAITLELGKEPITSTASASVFSNTNQTLDFGFVIFTPTLELTKTVYLGNDSGKKCRNDQGEEKVIGVKDTDVTYCFEVANTTVMRDVWFSKIEIDDPALGISFANLTPITNSLPLTPTGVNYYYYQTTITKDLKNTATAKGTPSTEGGKQLLGISDVTDTDSAEVDLVTPGANLKKTVYYGHDNGASCSTSGEKVTNISGALVTYCFEIENTGDTYLNDLEFADATLAITDGDLSPKSVVMPLPGSQSAVYYYESKLNKTLTNEATIVITPTDNAGNVYTGVAALKDIKDTANVEVITPTVQLKKTVYQGHDNGQSCAKGIEKVTDVNGANVTYCFEVTNIGNSYLNITAFSDAALGVTLAKLEKLSGNLPLVPNSSTGKAVYYYETTITKDLQNTATVTANPVDVNNKDYPNVNNVTGSDTAEVDLVAPAISIEKSVYAGDNGLASCGAASDVITSTVGMTVTYCFKVTNTGDTKLNQITIKDDKLNIDSSSWISSTQVLTQNLSWTFHYTTTITGDLKNTATVEGNPIGDDGKDLPGLENPTGSDTADVKAVAPKVKVEKTAYLSHDNGANCGTNNVSKSLVAKIGFPITYCFVVTNEGDTYLDQIDLDDNVLGLDETDMTKLSSSAATPLAPGNSLSYYYTMTLVTDVENTAIVKANPTSQAGTDLPDLPLLTEKSDPVKVDVVSPAVELKKTVKAGAYAAGGGSCVGSEKIQATNGDDVTYCFQIRNTGDTHLNISLTDNMLGIDLSHLKLISGTLPLSPTESLEYYYNAKVTDDLVNVAEVIANPVYDNFIDLPNIPDVSDKDSASVDLVSQGITLEKQVYLGYNGGASCSTAGLEVVSGEANSDVTYCFEVTNTSQTHLDVSIEDATLDIPTKTLLPFTSTVLAPGSSQMFFAQTKIVTDVINIATATGNPVEQDGSDIANLPEVTDKDPAEVKLESPSVTLNKTVYAGSDFGAKCTGGYNFIVAQNNEAVTYCFRVTNTGNTYLNNIAVDDYNLGIDETKMAKLSNVNLLAPGQTVVYFYQTFVRGPVVNTANVSANPSDENGNDLTKINDVTDKDTATVSQAAPAITIQKTVAEGANATCPGGELVRGNDGEAITYCFVITNTGDTYLADVKFEDSKLDTTNVTKEWAGPFAPGAEIANFTIPATITGELLNTASVVANPVDATDNDLDGLEDVSSSDTASVGQAGLTLNKTVGVGHPQTGINCSTSGDLATATKGTAIFYCFEVVNSGSTYLNNVMITDTILGITITDMTPISASLPLTPGASISYYYESVITTSVVNTATATASPVDQVGKPLPNVADVKDDDQAEVVEVSSPDIALHKAVYEGHDSGATCPSDIEFVKGLPGTDITYCFEVENTGDTFLSNIVITDTPLGITQADMTPVSAVTITTLAPGASLVYYYDTKITGDLVNTANVTGTPSDQNGVPISGLEEKVTADDSTTVEDASSPNVKINKTVTRQGACPGDEVVEGVRDTAITYCFEVENTGDTYLASIVITDTLLGITQADMTKVSGDTTLAPGATLVYSYNAKITGDMVNTANVEAMASDNTGAALAGLSNVTDSDTAQVNEVGSPEVEIHKTVYLGQDGGASCSTSVELAFNQKGTEITYCFEVENSGETYLNNIIITDDPLSITQAAMTLSGTLPIAPGDSVVYYYETTIEKTLVNTAKVDANPTDKDGNDLAELANVTDSDTAQVQEGIPTALGLTDLTATQEGSVSSTEYWQGNGYSLAALLLLLGAAGALIYNTILNKQTE